MEEDKIIYIAAVEEKDKDEAKKYNCERYTILKGEYLTVAITHWRTKLESIKEVFHEMMKSSVADLRQPCIEWYRNDEDMECMLKCKSAH
jgi:predicted transcriptional regulator YdeE